MARPLLRAPAPSPPVPLDLVVQRPSKKGLWKTWKTSAYYDVLTSAEMVQNHFHDKRRWIAELHEYISAALNVNFWRAGDGSTSFENMLKVSLGRQRDLHYARLGSSSASDAVPPYFCQPTQLRICELLRMTRQENSSERSAREADWTLQPSRDDPTIPDGRGLMGMYNLDFIGFKSAHEGMGFTGLRLIPAVIGELKVTEFEIKDGRYTVRSDPWDNVEGHNESYSDMDYGSDHSLTLPSGSNAADKVAKDQFERQWQAGLAKMVAHGLTCQEYCNARLMFAIVDTRYTRAVMVEAEPVPVLALEVDQSTADATAGNLCTLASFLHDTDNAQHLPWDLWEARAWDMNFEHFGPLLDIYETAFAQLLSTESSLPFSRLPWDVESSVISKIRAQTQKYRDEHDMGQPSRLQELRRRNAEAGMTGLGDQKHIPSGTRGTKRKAEQSELSGKTRADIDNKVRQWQTSVESDQEPKMTASLLRSSAHEGPDNSFIDDVDVTDSASQTGQEWLTYEEMQEREGVGEERRPVDAETLMTIFKESGALVALVSPGEMNELLRDVKASCPAAQTSSKQGVFATTST